MSLVLADVVGSALTIAEHRPRFNFAGRYAKNEVIAPVSSENAQRSLTLPSRMW